MRYLTRLLKAALFAVAVLFVVTFAAKNTAPVTVRYYLGSQWEAPLILVLLAFFVAGALMGLVAGLTQAFRQRREVAALERELRAREINPVPEAPRDAA